MEKTKGFLNKQIYKRRVIKEYTESKGENCFAIEVFRVGHGLA